MAARARDRAVFLAAALSIGAVAVALRVASFHSYADSWDPCEYVWAVQDGYLPHSPYILYLWLGRLAALVMPADVGLSAISLIAGLAAVASAGILVRRQTGSATAGCLAAAAMAVFPGAVWFSGIQEVYALAAALGFGALLLAHSAGRPTGVLSGLVFGGALATHSGMIFAAPAWALALTGMRLRAIPWERAGAAVAAACIAPAAAVAWVAWVLPRGASSGGGLAGYLTGIAPLPGAEAPALDSVGRVFRGVLEQTLVAPATAMVLAGCAVVALVRFPRVVTFWLVHAAPYLAYEALIGWNVDPGVHMVFAGPAIAAILGCGAEGIAFIVGGRAGERPAAHGRPKDTAPRRWLPAMAVALIVVALLPAAAASRAMADKVVSRATFLSSEPVRTLRSLREKTPPDAVVVQPHTLDNVNLIPAYARRRPIIFQEGLYLLFEGERGAPLNLSSFSPLTGGRLEALRSAGTPVISMVFDPFDVSALGLTWKRERDYYRLDQTPP